MGAADDLAEQISSGLSIGFILIFVIGAGIGLILLSGVLLAYPILIPILIILYILYEIPNSVKCVRCAHKAGDHENRTEYCNIPLCPCLHFRDPNVWKPGVNWDTKNNTPKR